MAVVNTTNSLAPVNGQGNSSAHSSHANGKAEEGTTFSVVASAPKRLTPQLAASPSSAGHTDPRHITNNSMSSEGHDFFEQVLKMRAFRQELLASNLANTDTPGYKAVDIDVASSVQNLLASGRVMPLAQAITDIRHMAQRSESMPFSVPVKYRIPAQMSIDGNTVEQDVEMAQFTDNSIRYQFTLDRVGGHYKHMLEMLRNLK